VARLGQRPVWPVPCQLRELAYESIDLFCQKNQFGEKQNSDDFVVTQGVSNRLNGHCFLHQLYC
jgi:hypothetical protein